MLDPADLEQLRALLRAELTAPPRNDRILTLDEAKAYTKHTSDSAFYRWASRWRVTSAVNGRFAREFLDRALEREAANRRLGRCGPRRPRRPRVAQAPTSQHTAA
jgi:hypothetical protein